jgi:hypothetical protein
VRLNVEAPCGSPLCLLCVTTGNIIDLPLVTVPLTP